MKNFWDTRYSDLGDPMKQFKKNAIWGSKIIITRYQTSNYQIFYSNFNKYIVFVYFSMDFVPRFIMYNRMDKSLKQL